MPAEPGSSLPACSRRGDQQQLRRFPPPQYHARCLRQSDRRLDGNQRQLDQHLCGEVRSNRQQRRGRMGGAGLVAVGERAFRDRPCRQCQIVNTTAGPVVAWLDTSSGHANVYVRQFTARRARAGQWRGQRHGDFRLVDKYSRFSLATNGTIEAIAWTQPGTSAGNSIFLKQNSGSGWAAINGSASTTGISGATPRPCQASPIHRALFAAWAAVIGGTTNIAAATNNDSAWSPVSIDTPKSAGPGQISRGAASHPVLSSNGASLELAWVEDRLLGTTNQAVAIYADQLTGGSFVRQLAGDASFDGILHQSTSLSGPATLRRDRRIGASVCRLGDSSSVCRRCMCWGIHSPCRRSFTSTTA